MSSLVWLLPAAPPTHYELIGEVLEELLRTLSEKLRVWGITFNPALPGKGYFLHIWNAQGRLVSFYGKWNSGEISREIEKLWMMESFIPTAVLTNHQPWSKLLVRRWQRRLGAAVLSILSEDRPLFLPGGFFDSPAVEPHPKTLCLFIANDAAEEAAYVADLLSLEKNTVYLIGTPREVTPLRNAAARFPTRIHLRLGLPWMETQLYIDRAAAVIGIGRLSNEEVSMQVGRPWIISAQHPMAKYAYATYRRLEEIPPLLNSLSPPPAPLSRQDFVKEVLARLPSKSL
ncbi:MAG: hypothetical protein N2253_07815 [Bacteroidia bacterium]|nr:hypothetical protein [Bacteroidia bacterium]MCX7764779.1 hypothetical protein [Bacteroidia bacterium]MDW8057806.1 hypothetical protein [Bacteroidia bacterium]